jgi:hypothetical protein
MDSISPSFGVQLSPIFSLFRISYTSDWGYFSLFTKIPIFVVIELSWSQYCYLILAGVSHTNFLGKYIVFRRRSMLVFYQSWSQHVTDFWCTPARSGHSDRYVGIKVWLTAFTCHWSLTPTSGTHRLGGVSRIRISTRQIRYVRAWSFNATKISFKIREYCDPKETAKRQKVVY